MRRGCWELVTKHYSTKFGNSIWMRDELRARGRPLPGRQWRPWERHKRDGKGEGGDVQSIAYRRHGNPEDGPGLGLRLREMQKSCYPSAAGLAPGKMRSGGKNPSDCRILHGLVAS